MRDRADNCVIICSIENVDPMGVHTGDSITVAPAQTLSDVEYQRMRDAAFACIRRVGVETGGSNVQFAVNPDDGDMVVIEMNPRVSRLERAGVEGHRLPDRQDRRPARRRLHARRDPQRHHRRDAGQLRADHRLRGHQGAPLGVREVPRHPGGARHPDAVGGRGHGHRPHLPRVAAEGAALARARPPRPQLRPGRGRARRRSTDDELLRRAAIGTPDRPFQLEARAAPGHHRRAAAPTPPGSTPGSSTRSLPIIEERAAPGRDRLRRHDPRRPGGGPSGSASATPSSPTSGACAEAEVRAARLAAGVGATFKTVDTCAAEFEAETPYHYSTYEDEDEVRPATGRKVVILGLGPQPHRPGHRVRLLLRPRQLRPARRRLRDDHGQLQPRDGVAPTTTPRDRLYFEPLTSRTCSTSSRPEQARATWSA